MPRFLVAFGLGMLICFVLSIALPIDTSVAQEAKPDQKARQRDRQSTQDRPQQGRTRPGQQGKMQRGSRGQRGGRGGGEDGSLVVGEIAPDFTLKALEGDGQTQLASFKGKKPVILFFGSYT